MDDHSASQAHRNRWRSQSVLFIVCIKYLRGIDTVPVGGDLHRRRDIAARTVITSRVPADSLTGHRRRLVCGVSQTPGETTQSAVRCGCQADRSPFARANSRVAVDQTGAGAFSNWRDCPLPSATLSSISWNRNGTPLPPPLPPTRSRVEPGAATCCRLWYWRG